MSKLPKSFYMQYDSVLIAKSLIGKNLCTRFNKTLTTGMIVETEAYKAPEDMASHAYNNRKTKRTIPFYKNGGIAYVYMIYGVYYLFNVVTNIEGVPHAVLIRAVEPKAGIDTMTKRHHNQKKLYKLTSGPGLLSTALGIDISHNMTDLQGNKIWIIDSGFLPCSSEVNQTTRVGINVPEPWKSMPWRFYLKNNPWVSKK